MNAVRSGPPATVTYRFDVATDATFQTVVATGAVPEGSTDVFALKHRRAGSTDILHFPARVFVTEADHLMWVLDDRNVFKELNDVRNRPKIIPMTMTVRPPQRYDHRLRDLVRRTRDVTIAMDLGVPPSTARGWLSQAPKVVVSLDVKDLRTSELQQEVLELRRRVKKLTALLRLALALPRSSRFTLTHQRLPDGPAKIRILRAVDRAGAYVPLRALLRFLRLSPSRFHAWRRLQPACALADQSSCPHTFSRSRCC
jgi:hypothetical protein